MAALHLSRLLDLARGRETRERVEGAPIPYVPIERHAIIGDRRTAALVAADGTLDWLCVPRYDSGPVFGALLDAEKGGHCRFAPRARVLGVQSYPSVAPVVETRFELEQSSVTLVDAMIDPEHPRATGEQRRTVVRRLVADSDAPVPCVLSLAPRDGSRLRAWSTIGEVRPGTHAFVLRPREEAWLVLAFDDEREWTADRARAAVDATRRWWHQRCERFAYEGTRRERVLRSLVTIELLGDASTGATVAAATTSLPERIGGDWNVDYRFAWVRDSALSAATLARAGDERSGKRYLDWLAGLGDPLQVVYRTDGDEDLSPKEQELAGYRGSQPVRFGNHAFEQKQLGIYGFVTDCAHVYREHGGEWNDAHTALIVRAAEHTAKHWDEADNGIWELPKRRRLVTSRVTSWLALDRASRIGEELGRSADASRWREVAREIARQVNEEGWSEERGAFVHAFGDDALDAAALLLPITRLVTPDDPRARRTIEAIARELVLDGWVHRFDPTRIAGLEPLPMGEFEGAFVLCTAWLASAWSIVGEPDRAAQILDRLDAFSGPLGLFAEGVDARTGTALGNFPLLFAHAEYVRAVVELDRARRRAHE